MEFCVKVWAGSFCQIRIASGAGRPALPCRRLEEPKGDVEPKGQSVTLCMSWSGDFRSMRTVLPAVLSDKKWKSLWLRLFLGIKKVVGSNLLSITRQNQSLNFLYARESRAAAAACVWNF